MMGEMFKHRHLSSSGLSSNYSTLDLVQTVLLSGKLNHTKNGEIFSCLIDLIWHDGLHYNFCQEGGVGVKMAIKSMHSDNTVNVQ